jgi:hypothetical protein
LTLAIAAGLVSVAGVGAAALGSGDAAPRRVAVKPVTRALDPAFMRGVGRVLRWLETKERPIALRLDRATTRRERVAATKQLWWAYAGAAKRLRALDAGAADELTRHRLAEALRLAGCAYGRAAGHRDAAGYAREGELALVHQVGVRRALDAFAAAGYTLPSSAADATRFPHLPPL